MTENGSKKLCSKKNRHITWRRELSHIKGIDKTIRHNRIIKIMYFHVFARSVYLI